MGIVLSIIASVSSGISVLFSKKGLKDVNVYLVNALTNIVILMVFLVAVLISSTINQIFCIERWDLLIVSSVMLAVAWLLYYAGLKEGTVGGVLALQNLSIIGTMILETIILKNPISITMICGSILIIIGSFAMATSQKKEKKGASTWIIYEIISALAMSVSFIFTKMDSSPIDSNVLSLIRYGVVTLVMVVPTIKSNTFRGLQNCISKSIISIVNGGVLLGVGYLLLYKAMTMGGATVVTTIFRFNIVIATVVSKVIFHEESNKKINYGLGFMFIGIILMTI